MKKCIWLLLVASITNIAYAADKNKANEDAQFDQQFETIDSDHDGKISKPEAELKAPAMAEAFKLIDTNHDGYLSKHEIKTFTAKLLKSREEFNRSLKAADKDKNNKLSREESKAIPKLYENFDTIDTNHDGQLVIKEITDFLRAQLKVEGTPVK